jgi:hypothetical protein
MHQTQSAVLQPSRKAVAGLIMSGSLRKGLRGRQGQVTVVAGLSMCGALRRGWEAGKVSMAYIGLLVRSAWRTKLTQLYSCKLQESETHKAIHTHKHTHTTLV